MTLWFSPIAAPPLFESSGPRWVQKHVEQLDLLSKTLDIHEPLLLH